MFSNHTSPRFFLAYPDPDNLNVDRLLAHKTATVIERYNA